ncbi:MAG: response regulator [Alphaproteobacteria bacterium]|nr:response regulator [Alphaproteobacteria bacterium]
MTSIQASGPVVLLVEDNAEMREFVARALGLNGYQAIEAADGVGALALLAGRDDCALLITDVMLPGGMNGAELARQACALRPALRIMFMSGYADTVIDALELDRLGATMLAKPFRVRELEERLRSIFAA